MADWWANDTAVGEAASVAAPPAAPTESWWAGDSPVGEKKFKAKIGASETFNPAESNGLADDVRNLLAGIGYGMKSVYLGGKQRLGLASQEEVNQFKDEAVPLLATKAGFVGNIGGQSAALAAAATVLAPAGAIAAGGALGVIGGATTPTYKEEDPLGNAAIGGVAGAVLGGGSALLDNVVTARNLKIANAKAANSVRDETAKLAVGLGYKLSPVEANPGNKANQLLEGVGGGKFLTRQTATLDNQTLTDSITRSSLPGFGDDTPLLHSNLQTYRDQVVGQAYAPLKEMGDIPTGGPGGALDNALANVGEKVTALGGKFKIFREAAKRINDAVSDLNGQTVLNADDAISLISEYRANAAALFKNAKGINGTRADFHEAHAQLQIADALEGFLDQHAQQVAKTYSILGDAEKSAAWARKVGDFQKGRALIARSLDIDRALTGDGHVNAWKFGDMLGKRPLGGGLEQVARIAKTFRHVMGPVARTGAVPQFSLADAAIGATSGVLGKPGSKTLTAVSALFGRPAIRALILSKLYQKGLGMAIPSYRGEMLAPAGAALGDFTARGAVPAALGAGQPEGIGVMRQ